MVVMYEDFGWGWMAWETVSVLGDQEWVIDNYLGIDGNYAKMSGYSGGANVNEDWLISPPMNLDVYTGETLTFYSAKGYSGADIEVKYSTNYDFGGNPATATWNTLTATISAGSWAWTASGDVDLSGVAGSSVCLAFIYTSDASDAATWEIDNILVYAASGPEPADIVINEIMYNSPGTDEEWIELYNNSGMDVDVSGWFVQDNDPTHTPIAIPSGTILSDGQYYTISIDSDGNFPFTPDLDGTLQADWSLSNSGDDVNLFNLGRISADYVPYSDATPWPSTPDGNGPSLSLLDPDLDNTMGENWAASLQADLGSPGAENFPPVPTILLSSPIGGEAWEQGSMHDITWSTIVYTGQIKIELIDTNTWVPQLLVSNISSSLNSWTWTIMSGQATGDDYIIRISDLASGPVGESPNTFSIVVPYVQPEIVITEIMYNPPESGNDSLEFIELYNNGTEPVDMTGFEFDEGVGFIFPAVILNPAEYLLVSVDSVAMFNAFGTMAYQWTSGALSNGGELIQLVDNNGFFVDSVRYDDHMPWDSLADGFGPSLTLCDPGLDNGLAGNWTASTEFAIINSVGDSIWATPLAGCAMIYPTANFEAADSTIVVGTSADFFDLSTGGTMISWAWTFEGGDPATSTEQNPVVMYATEGMFDVSLEVENEFGEFSTLTKIDYISTGYAPEVAFEADATNPAVGQGVNFTDLSTGDATEWSWEFEGGDPATSMDQNPSGITWAVVGLYDVSLTATNEFGSTELIKEDYIDVHPIGINENSLDDMIRIYPNPANGILNIENTSGEKITLSIYSLTGQMVLESKIQNGSEVINLSNMNKGIYFVRYITENQLVKTSKLIIH
jgi:PKD repeat protein